MTRWRHEYYVKGDAVECVRWCRQNLGARGFRWDFGFRYLGRSKQVILHFMADEDALLYDQWRFWNVLSGNNQAESHHLSQP